MDIAREFREFRTSPNLLMLKDLRLLRYVKIRFIVSSVADMAYRSKQCVCSSLPDHQLLNLLLLRFRRDYAVADPLDCL